MVVPKAVSWKSIPNGMEEKVVEIWIASRDAWASEQVVSDPSLPSLMSQVCLWRAQKYSDALVFCPRRAKRENAEKCQSVDDPTPGGSMHSPASRMGSRKPSGFATESPGGPVYLFKSEEMAQIATPSL